MIFYNNAILLFHYINSENASYVFLFLIKISTNIFDNQSKKEEKKRKIYFIYFLFTLL